MIAHHVIVITAAPCLGVAAVVFTCGTANEFDPLVRADGQTGKVIRVANIRVE